MREGKDLASPKVVGRLSDRAQVTVMSDKRIILALVAWAVSTLRTTSLRRWWFLRLATHTRAPFGLAALMVTHGYSGRSEGAANPWR
jgi:hypothetical protein